jgi:hypothetical protein
MKTQRGATSETTRIHARDYKHKGAAGGMKMQSQVPPTGTAKVFRKYALYARQHKKTDGCLSLNLGDLIRNRGEGYSGRTKPPLQMGCGWRNPEGVANNYLERHKPLASKADCIERAAQPQTSGIRDALPQFAMMISLQPTSSLYHCKRAKKAMQFSPCKVLRFPPPLLRKSFDIRPPQR